MDHQAFVLLLIGAFCQTGCSLRADDRPMADDRAVYDDVRLEGDYDLLQKQVTYSGFCIIFPIY